jgi:penicillin-binding protein-related factor A (putative recombinase)|tara:strand:+ start:2521 stop:2910 length:390 start_codon:yes stop_codon:yes gene_type:complete
MAKEKNLWLLLRKNLPQIHLQRIETGMTGSGVPDVNGCAKGKEFWIELKEIHSGNALTLRPMQISWLAKRALHGGQVFVMARKNNEIKLYHIDSLTGIKELVKNGYSSDALLILNIPYDWGALTTALLS